MAANIFLLVILLIILFVIIIFSVNLNIILSFYLSLDDFLNNNHKSYIYAVCVNKVFRTASNNKKSKKSNSKSKIIHHIKRSRHHIEISNVSIRGNVAVLDNASTAITAGIAYIAAGLFIPFLSNYAKTVNISSICINPVYSGDFYGDIFFECIIKCNLGDIITEEIKHFLYERK